MKNILFFIVFLLPLVISAADSNEVLIEGSKEIAEQAESKFEKWIRTGRSCGKFESSKCESKFVACIGKATARNKNSDRSIKAAEFKAQLRAEGEYRDKWGKTKQKIETEKELNAGTEESKTGDIEVSDFLETSFEYIKSSSEKEMIESLENLATRIKPLPNNEAEIIVVMGRNCETDDAVTKKKPKITNIPSNSSNDEVREIIRDDF
jgi:hypothetical protein